MNPERRTADERVTKLVSDVEDLKRQMAENTAVTKDVRDILGSFKVLRALALWVAAVVGAAITIKSGVTTFFK